MKDNVQIDNEQIEEIQETHNEAIRECLIGIRDEVKEGKILDTQTLAHIRGLLACEEPKVRRLAAQILGNAGDMDSLRAIFMAYRSEETMYIRADYLTAIGHLDYTSLMPKLKKRLRELSEIEVDEDKKVHIAKETKVLRDLIVRKEGVDRHTFCGLSKEQEVLLTTKEAFQDITIDQLPYIPRKKVSMGVMVKTTDVLPLCEIRTFDEMLFYMGETTNQKVPNDVLANELIRLGVVDLIRTSHREDHPMGVRIQLEELEESEKRNQMAKRLGAALTAATDGFLVNATTGYEAEIRMFSLSQGGFRIFVKLCTIPMNRFNYRSEAVAASMRPSLAAGLCFLGRPYMKAGAQVIDPFCGVGTMLVERRMLLRTGDVYGVDSFGEAILKARLNCIHFGPTIHFINKDFRDFEHDYPFDELITDMPTQSPQVGREEIKATYELLFEKGRELLRVGGTMFVYGNEHGFMKEQLRRNKNFTLLREYLIDERRDSHFYIIRYEER